MKQVYISPYVVKELKMLSHYFYNMNDNGFYISEQTLDQVKSSYPQGYHMIVYMLNRHYTSLPRYLRDEYQHNIPKWFKEDVLLADNRIFPDMQHFDYVFA